MSKAVLVMKQPESCCGCPVNHGQFCMCKVGKFDTREYAYSVHPKCPLKPLPKKQELTMADQGQDLITRGWNACIEAIEEN